MYDKKEPNPLAQTWKKRISAAKKHWEKFHKRVKYSREVVAGFNWNSDPRGKEFVKHRANLIHGTITATLPNIYAKNPEISVTPRHSEDRLKLFCKTIETVLNQQLSEAKLKVRAKSSVRAAMTVSMGIVKVMYQRDYETDSLIKSRIEDAQDNIATIERLMTETEDDQQRGDLDSKKAELQQAMASLSEQLEVVAAEGLVIDRVLTEHLIIDPTVTEFLDYPQAAWMAQIVPMRRSDAEAQYKCDLSSAVKYKPDGQLSSTVRDMRLASADGGDAVGEDEQIAVLEIWDKTTHRIYTMADGCDFWLREPYAPPKVGQRWYPFFCLPFQIVDGQFVGPSLVDLTELLQDEHNAARNKFNKHRDLCKPGWIAAGTISEKSIKRYQDSEIGEITLIDTEGQPLNQYIQPRQHPPIDPAVYDTSAVRYDWEQVTGMQDAARSGIVNPKTATEATIMQQSLTGRVGEFVDQMEDWLGEIAQYSAEILLAEMTAAQVERIVGPDKTGVQDLGDGTQTEVVTEKSFDWPELSRDEIFDMVAVAIRPGTAGAPDKQKEREAWGELLPVIQGLVQLIMQVQMQGADPAPFENLLRETLRRFDDGLKIEEFLPAAPQMQPPMPPDGGQSPVDPEQMQQMQQLEGAM